MKQDNNLYPFGGLPINIPGVFRGIGQVLRDRMYKTVTPEGYTEDKIFDFISGEPRKRYEDPNTEALFGKYTDQDSIIANSYSPPEWFPKGRELSPEEIKKIGAQEGSELSKYAVNDLVIPSKSKEGAFELAYPNLGRGQNHLPDNMPTKSRWEHSHQLGFFEQKTGIDKGGSYGTYGDTYDINPFKGVSSDDNKGFFSKGKNIGLDVFGDIVPWGKPYEIYGKRYYNKESKPENKKEEGGAINSYKKWDGLSLAERAEMMKVAIQNGVTKLSDIKARYNEFAEGGDTAEPNEWKALNKINYESIPDTAFTKDKTGAGSIEYFAAEDSSGITYSNGYHRNHPKPGRDVILYNPKDNDYQDIRLDALHIMPKDATYDALNTLYRNAAKDSDVAYIARQRYNDDVKKYGINNVDSYEQYFNNEADGLLRNMFIEGTPKYIESKRYYPDKKQLREWNKPLLPYIDNIQKYLETGERPLYILPEVTVTGKKKALGGNLFSGEE